jgi:serine/threonine protein kinase
MADYFYYKYKYLYLKSQIGGGKIRDFLITQDIIIDDKQQKGIDGHYREIFYKYLHDNNKDDIGEFTTAINNLEFDDDSKMKLLTLQGVLNKSIKKREFDAGAGAGTGIGINDNNELLLKIPRLNIPFLRKSEVNDTYNSYKFIAEGGYGCVYINDDKKIVLKIFKNAQDCETEYEQHVAIYNNITSVDGEEPSFMVKTLGKIYDWTMNDSERKCGWMNSTRTYCGIKYEYGGPDLFSIMEREDMNKDATYWTGGFINLLKGVKIMQNSMIFHHDIKMENIVVKEDERSLILKLIDFGSNNNINVIIDCPMSKILSDDYEPPYYFPYDLFVMNFVKQIMDIPKYQPKLCDYIKTNNLFVSPRDLIFIFESLYQCKLLEKLWNNVVKAYNNYSYFLHTTLVSGLLYDSGLVADIVSQKVRSLIIKILYEILNSDNPDYIYERIVQQISQRMDIYGIMVAFGHVLGKCVQTEKVTLIREYIFNYCISHYDEAETLDNIIKYFTEFV